MLQLISCAQFVAIVYRANKLGIERWGTVSNYILTLELPPLHSTLVKSS